MWTVTIKGIWAHKLRFISTTIAIVLGVGFMSGTYIFTDTVGRSFSDLFASVYKTTDAVVRTHKLLDQQGGGGDRRARMPAAILDEVRTVPTVEHAEGFIRGYAQVIKKSNKPLGGRNAPAFGLAWIDDARLNPFHIASGRPPAADNEIAIDRASARIGAFSLGDSVKVLTQTPTSSYTIVGIMTFGTADSAAAASSVAFTPAQAARVFETGGEVDSVVIVAKPGVTQEQVAADVAKAVGSSDREVLTGKGIVAQTQSDLRKRLSVFTRFLGAFALLALFVGMFVISNTFSILVAQRTRELALLRAIGASRRQVLGSVMAEAVVIGVVASMIGLGAGVLLALGLKAVFAASGFTLPGGALIILARTIIVALLAGTVITVLSALFPAWRAGLVPPLAAIRDIAIDRSASSRMRLVAGLVLLVGTAALAVAGLQGSGHVMTEGAAFAASIVTVTVLGPTIARPLGRALGAPIRRLRGMPGALAQQNAVRNPRRTSRTALALTIGVAVVGMVLTFVASFNGLIAKTVDGQFKADYIITNKSFSGFSPQVARNAAATPGVAAVTGVRFGDIKVFGAAEAVAAFDTATVAKLIDLPVVSGSVEAVGLGDIAISDKLAREHHVGLGDSIPVVMPAGIFSTRIVALMDSVKLQALTQGGSALISLSTYDRGFTQHLDFQVYVKAAKGANLDAVSTGLQKSLVDYPTADVLDQAEYKRSISDQLNQFVVIVFILLALSVIIALFGVANTLLLSIHERTREIGLLRAVGMTRAQIRSAVRWESVIMAVLGVLIGLFLGVVFGVLIMRSLHDDGFTKTVVPVGSLVFITVVGIVFGVLAGIRPASKAAKLNMLQAIGTE
jgi:putative ABC transport system permease protein